MVDHIHKEHYAHICDDMKKAEEEEHQISRIETSEKRRIGPPQHGPAIRYIIKMDGYWFAYNDEYSSVIHYCPYCGVYLGRVA